MKIHNSKIHNIQSFEENEKVFPEHNLNANPFPLDGLLFKKLFIQKASSLLTNEIELTFSCLYTSMNVLH